MTDNDIIAYMWMNAVNTLASRRNTNSHNVWAELGMAKLLKLRMVQSTDSKVGNIENVLNDSTDPIIIAYELINIVNTLASLKKCQLTRGLG